MKIGALTLEDGCLNPEREAAYKRKKKGGGEYVSWKELVLKLAA